VNKALDKEVTLWYTLRILGVQRIPPKLSGDWQSINAIKIQTNISRNTMTYTKKLDEKIKELNSTRVFKKVTPMHTLDWYIKWVSSAIILLAVMCRSVDEVPRIFDLVFSFFGTIGWFVVGYLWHDRALILLNGVLVFMLGMALLRYFFT
jgi:hypothetical protein